MNYIYLRDHGKIGYPNPNFSQKDVFGDEFTIDTSSAFSVSQC